MTSSKNKRILLITADGSPSGGVTSVLQLCRGVAKREEWTVALCSQTASYAVQTARECCDALYEVDFFTSRFDPRIVRSLKRIIRAEAPDVVHTHGSRAGLPSIYALRGTKAVHIHTVHGFHFYEKLRLLRRLAIRAERRIAARADHIVFVCERDRDVALHENILTRTAASSVVYNGVALADLSPRKSEIIRKVGFLGRLIYQKRPEMLIEVADRLRDMGLSFLMIGGGALQEELVTEARRRGLADSVWITGAISRERALSMAAEIDIAILPSRWEGFPIALLELMGMEIPVIASDVNGISEIIEDGVNGFLVKGGDPDLYAVRIRELLNEPGECRRIGQAARVNVTTRFSESSMLEKLIDIYLQS